MLMLRNITDGICPRAFLADKKVSNCQKLITCFKAFDSIGNSFLVYLSLIEVRSYKFSKVFGQLFSTGYRLRVNSGKYATNFGRLIISNANEMRTANILRFFLKLTFCPLEPSDVTFSIHLGISK